MDTLVSYLPHLSIAFATYLVATASPGPANIAIMGTAMRAGRAAGLALAAGVISGSIFWGLMAAFGLAGLLSQYGAALEYLKIACGLYLFWLAWKSLRATLQAKIPSMTSDNNAQPKALRQQYLRGLLIHLTNPKAIFSWLAIMALGIGDNAPGDIVVWILTGCFLMGIGIFGSYALVFSTQTMISLYQRARRRIEAVLTLVFGAAGIRMLASSL